ncbi:MAG TPA: PAS domain S-box protein [Burkholderiaceae bacterium]|nr:PAS domain S-box protein [Burkholderiaceae bacterium]
MGGVDFEALVGGFGDAVIVADSDGNIVYWNPAATRIFGFSEGEALGRTLSLIVPERQRGRHDEGYAKTMATGETRYGTSLLRVPALHKDGHTISIAFTVSMLKSADGQVQAIAAVMRDETARFAEERALRKRLTELEMAAAAKADTAASS